VGTVRGRDGGGDGGAVGCACQRTAAKAKDKINYPTQAKSGLEWATRRAKQIGHPADDKANAGLL
jgi:hypothetical protein